MHVAVIGSGFSGLSVAHALLARGCAVTMIDVGETLQENRRRIVAKLRELPSQEWPAGDFDVLRENPTFASGDLPKKMFFGSDAIYADDRPFAHIQTLAPGRAPFPTFTRGGFSNVWGAAVLPVDSCDMTDWPVSRTEMDPYFEKAARLMPLTGGAGTLSRSFPPYKDELGEVDAGPQGEALLHELKRAEHRLLAEHTLYGKARLAIHTIDDPLGPLACNASGECFVGCVRGSIFAATPVLDDMIRKKRIDYRAGIFVESVGESGGKAAIEGLDVASKARCRLTYDAVFVAGGPINTSRMLLRSRRLYDQHIVLKESQKFALPILRRRAAATAIEHPSVTMASVFLETKVPALSDHWLHVQIVPMNQMILDATRLPMATSAAGKRLWAPFLRRVMVAWCGMHSDHSSSLRLRLRPGEADGDTLELDLRVSEDARWAARQAARSLFRRGLMFGSVFCHWMIKFSNPGSGTHCGASFPMKRNPTDLLDTDPYGRPFGWSRVFVVDSSILPSIPGTTLAFPVMANAYRIGSTAPL